MKWMLDTNACIRYLNGRAPHLRDRLDQANSADVVICSAYGAIRADLPSRGTPIGPNDLMIAAIALRNGVTLVTNNSAEFGRVAGLKIEDWEAPPSP